MYPRDPCNLNLYVHVQVEVPFNFEHDAVCTHHGGNTNGRIHSCKVPAIQQPVKHHMHIHTK